VVRPTEAWYQQSEEEQNALLADVGASLEKAGGKTVLSCSSAWSSEQWMFFGVEEFPDIDAVQKYGEELLALDWFRYIESMSMLATKWEPS